MDLLSSIRKEGSRGGVDFKWSDVTTSQHRENYLGHSLMAPVGRWQKNRDLSWYAKGDSDPLLKKDGTTETSEEKRVRERKEEIRRIKEAEEDALARALGLPVADRGIHAIGTGANGIDVGEVKRLIKETEAGDEEIEKVGRARGFGDFIGKLNADGPERPSDLDLHSQKGGLIGADSTPRRARRSIRTDDNRSRSGSHSRDGRHRRHTHHNDRDSGGGGDPGGRYRPRERDAADARPRERRNRSHSPHVRERQYRSERTHRQRSRSRSPARREERQFRSRSRSVTPPRRRERTERDRDGERERDRDRRGSGAEYRAAQSRRSRPPDPREKDRVSRRQVGADRWR